MALNGMQIRCSPGPLKLQTARKSSIVHSLAQVKGYAWEEVPAPMLQHSGRRLVEEVRIRSHEVGPNQQSDIVTISNILQVLISPIWRNRRAVFVAFFLRNAQHGLTSPVLRSLTLANYLE